MATVSMNPVSTTPGLTRTQFYWSALWLILFLPSLGWLCFAGMRLLAECQGSGAALRSDGSPIAVDFAQYVAVARAWETDRIDHIYDREEQIRLVREVSGKPAGEPWSFDERSLTYSYPPFMLWLSRPLVGLEYRTALLFWLTGSLVLLGVCLWFWCAELEDQPAIARLVLATYLVLPFVTGNFMTGQMVFLAVLGFTGAFYALHRGHDFLAGLFISLLFYKPLFGVLLGPVILYQLRGRVVAGVAVGGLLCLLASLAAGPGLLAEWLAALRALRDLAQSIPHYYDKHFGWLALVAVPAHLPLKDYGPVLLTLWLVPVALVVVLLFWAWSQPWRPGSDRFSAALAATVLATSFVAPYHFFYDVCILGVALVYSAKTWRHRPQWHAFAVLVALMLLVGGMFSMTATEYFRQQWGFAIQFAPVGTLLWFLVEVRAARTLPIPEEETQPARV